MSGHSRLPIQARQKEMARKNPASPIRLVTKARAALSAAWLRSKE
jgi:hypothetical protein